MCCRSIFRFLQKNTHKVSLGSVVHESGIQPAAGTVSWLESQHAQRQLSAASIRRCGCC